MAQLIAGKSNEYASSLPATSFYPSLVIADFQKVFHFLEDQTEDSILLQMEVDRANVHRQLKTLMETHPNLGSRSQELFENDTTAEALYKQAVFSLTAANLIGSKMAMDATSEAADRQEALTDKADHLLKQYRHAVDQLLQTDSGYTIELI